MALRSACAAALRSGTDLGVNNARTFVTTGNVTIFLSHIVYIEEVRGRASVSHVQCEAVTGLHALFCGERHCAKLHWQMWQFRCGLVIVSTLIGLSISHMLPWYWFEETQAEPNMKGCFIHALKWKEEQCLNSSCIHVKLSNIWMEFGMHRGGPLVKLA